MQNRLKGKDKLIQQLESESIASSSQVDGTKSTKQERQEPPPLKGNLHLLEQRKFRFVTNLNLYSQIFLSRQSTDSRLFHVDNEVRMLEIMEASASQELERFQQRAELLSKELLVAEESVWLVIVFLFSHHVDKAQGS